MFSVVDLQYPPENMFIFFINGIKGTPLSLISFSLVLISLYLLAYQNRRNIGIYLINGRSKFQFIKYIGRDFIKLFIPTTLVSFIVFQIINPTVFSHLISILSIFTLLVLLLMIIFYLCIILFVYSFTEIKTNSYLYGYSKKSITSLVTFGFKVTLTSLLLLNVFSVINRAYWSRDVIRNAPTFASAYTDIYIFYPDNLSNVIHNSNQLIENLNANENGYLVSNKIDMGSSEDETQINLMENKIVHANNNYIKKQKLYLEDGKPVEDFKSGSLYITKENYNLLKEQNSHILSTLGDDKEVVIISNESSIIPLTNNVISKSLDLTNDFILINREMDQYSYIPEVFIEMDSNQLAEEKAKLLANTPLEDIGLINLGEMFEEEYAITVESFRWEIQWTFVYILVIYIISRIHNQVLFDKRVKEYTVYYVNGISKIGTFYRESLYQIIVSSLIILFIKNSRYIDSPFSYTFIPFICVIVIELFIVFSSTRKFHKDIGFIVKERL